MTIIATPYREIVHYHGLNVDSFSRLQAKIFRFKRVLLGSLYKQFSLGGHHGFRQSAVKTANVP